MSEITQRMPAQMQAVVFTQNAASKVLELMQEEDNFDLKLRAFVTGGGCSGMQYGFTFEETINDDDTVITVNIKAAEYNDKANEQQSDENEGGDGGATSENSVQLLIDPMSLQYLLGAEIDYTEDVQGAQFVIRNPNAKTTCGCGSSFSV